MPSKERNVFKYQPEELGWKIEHIPKAVLDDSTWTWISEFHNLLLFGTKGNDGLFIYDVTNDEWKPPFLPSDADSIEIAFTTKSKLLVAGFGAFHVCSLPDLKFQKVLKHENGGWAGAPFNDMALVPSEELGIDLISPDSESIKRKYRLPPEQVKFEDYCVDTINHNNKVLASLVENGIDYYFLIWNLETGKFSGYLNATCVDYEGPYLGDNLLYYENTIVNLHSLSITKELEEYSIAGLSGNSLIASKYDPDDSEDTYFVLYDLINWQRKKEIVVTGCELHQISFSSRYVLLKRSDFDPPYYVLIDFMDLLERSGIEG